MAEQEELYTENALPDTNDGQISQDTLKNLPIHSLYINHFIRG